MYKKEVRYSSLDLILQGGATSHMAARNRIVSRGQLSGIFLQGRVVSLLPKPEITRLQPMDASGEGDKRQTTSEAD